MIKFLDFDGVIVDSIKECYVVSRETYYGYTIFPHDENVYNELFYKFRGLVKPAFEYSFLHKAIDEYLLKKVDSIDILFHRNIKKCNQKVADFFEKKFFYNRFLHQEDDFLEWIKMNPLTEFGQLLIGRENSDIYIVTTKNRQATESILKHYNISVAGVYANDEIKSAGNKGNLIRNIMALEKINESMFLDDAVEHLETVSDDRVKCFFADWGYGINNNHQVLSREAWKDYI
jgi:phosphoglycolate phosphatase-like HAD superfamily hydrolase